MYKRQQFAFRSGSKEDTISLIEALAHSTDKVQSEEIMFTYRSKYDIKPAWVEQVENLLVALEMYRIEEEKAIIPVFWPFSQSMWNFRPYSMATLSVLPPFKKPFSG